MANIREDGYHVEVDDEGIETALRILRGICGVVEYQSSNRTFWTDETQVGAIDLWGNLVIYHDALGWHREYGACNPAVTVV